MAARAIGCLKFSCFLKGKVRGPGLSIEITSHQLREVGILDSNGFERDSSFFRSHFDLTKDLDERYQLADEFAIVSMQTDADYLVQLVRRLRVKIEPDPSGPGNILTIPGRGYRFRNVVKSSWSFVQNGTCQLDKNNLKY